MKTVVTLSIEEKDGRFYYVIDHANGGRNTGGSHYVSEAAALADGVLALEMALRPKGAQHAWALATRKAGEPNPWGAE